MEVKFRAYHTVNKVMMDNKSLSVLAKNIKDDIVWKFMQFTGLYDKNGNEIYIGDILKTSNNDEKYDLWEEKDFGYTIVVPLESELGIDFTEWYIDLKTEESVYNTKFVEIIGNIYQNPELLEQ